MSEKPVIVRMLEALFDFAVAECGHKRTGAGRTEMIPQSSAPASVPELKKRQCVHCAAGIGMSAHEDYHWDGSTNPPLCTAQKERARHELAERIVSIVILKIERILKEAGL